MSRENRRRSFRVTFAPDARPRAELCPFGADEGSPPVPGRVADLSMGGAAVLFPKAVPTPLLQRPWVVGFELPIGVGVSILSYAGGVQFGLITDSKLCPDPQAIIDRFQPEFDKLLLVTLMLPWAS